MSEPTREIAPDPARTKRLPVRVIASLCLLSVVAAMVITDRVVDRTKVNPASALVDAGPIATSDDARSSTWFCIGGTGEGEAVIVIANPTDQPRRGVVRIFSAAGELGTTNVVLQPGEHREVIFPSVPRPTIATTTTAPTSTPPSTTPNSSGPTTTTDLVVAPSELGPESERGVGAVLEFDGGGIVAEHRVEESVAPCAAAASPTWYLPDGATTRDAKTSLTLFNPFADDAIVDVFVTTNTSNARPSALQGVFVPGGTVRTVDLDRFVRRRSFLSATVTTRTGRVISEGFLRFDGSGTARGSTIVSASPTRGSAWYFPSGKSSSVLRERYFLTNPGDTDMTVELAFIAADREEPFEVDIPAKSIVEFDTADEERVPRGVDYSVVIASTSNRTFLASRRLVAKSKFRRGVASTLGARIQSNRWTVADASANAKIDDRLSIVNPTDDPALISLYQIGPSTPSAPSDWVPVAGVENIAMIGGSRLDIRLGDYVAVSGATFAVLSDGAPVIVDRTRVLVRTRGNRPERLPLVASLPEEVDTALIDTALLDSTDTPQDTSQDRSQDRSSASTGQAHGPLIVGRGFGVLAVSPTPSTAEGTATPAGAGTNTSGVATNSVSTAVGVAFAVTTTTRASTTTRVPTPITVAPTSPLSTTPSSTASLATTVATTSVATTSVATTVTTTSVGTGSVTTIRTRPVRVAVAVIAQAGLGTSTAIAVPAAGS